MAPGMAKTGRLASARARISGKPGSDSSGVPASEISASAAAGRDAVDDVLGLGPLIVLVQGDAAPLDAIVVEQPRRHAGILAEDDLGRGQRFERADGDVAQVADRGGHDIEARRQRRRREGGAGDEIARIGVRQPRSVG